MLPLFQATGVHMKVPRLYKLTNLIRLTCSQHCFLLYRYILSHTSKRVCSVIYGQYHIFNISTHAIRDWYIYMYTRVNKCINKCLTFYIKSNIRIYYQCQILLYKIHVKKVDFKIEQKSFTCRNVCTCI